MTSRAAAAALAILAIPLALGAQTTTPKTIGEVTLFGEEQLKVEAATKTEIPISKAPSAVTVITAKQIEESGIEVDEIPPLGDLAPVLVNLKLTRHHDVRLRRRIRSD